MTKAAALNDLSSPLTVTEQAIKTLRELIMCGDLRPGQKLIESDLSQQIGVSRPSLREALRALEADRLVEIVPNRGPFVVNIGATEIEEIHEVWALMTGDMVQRFAERTTPKELGELHALLRGLQVALREKNTIAQLDATNAFFRYIANRCGNDVLNTMVQTLVSRINFLRARCLSVDGWPALCAKEISEIFEAIQEGRPSIARSAAKRHIASACKAAKGVATRLNIDRLPRQRHRL